jgi:hypothetical protein
MILYIYLWYFGFGFVSCCKAILDCLISFVYIIIVSFDTKLDFLDIAHFLWYRLLYLVCVLLRCLYTVLLLLCVNLVSFGYTVPVLLNFYYFGSWYFKFEF